MGGCECATSLRRTVIVEYCSRAASTWCWRQASIKRMAHTAPMMVWLRRSAWPVLLGCVRGWRSRAAMPLGWEPFQALAVPLPRQGTRPHCQAQADTQRLRRCCWRRLVLRYRTLALMYSGIGFLAAQEVGYAVARLVVCDCAG
jgi:hypothetical protein